MISISKIKEDLNERESKINEVLNSKYMGGEILRVITDIRGMAEYIEKMDNRIKKLEEKNG